ncbi:alpha/beta hydrolase [Sphingobacterium paucimobilis]|uniref:Alpha/beta hydrolase n=1 Tax=Sphingobacterium paucimobilis HER1398 TaxID=1346330 RepID=U2HDR0_9SPHI|nr:alpha/beta hydrolase [Sphingobacterium paucimobilis]ERJ59906.1 hypothetical protein M472_14130 [Sphingobacterium paucimobilis HER1398]
MQKKIRVGNVRVAMLKLFMIVFIGLWSGCKSSETPEPPIPPPSKIPKDGVFLKRGEGSFTYKGYEPLSNKPITVYYYIPTTGNIDNMPVLFSMHGAERDGTIQRNAWKYLAEANGFVVIAPQYAKAYYSENEYQFGGVFTNTSFTIANAPDKWTYQTIEALFDYYKKETDSKAISYHMFGHSAGGQFVHRFLLAMPDARVDKAVAANPGGWTFPYLNGITGTDNKTYGWPNAVYGSPMSDENYLKKYFAKKLYIQLGQLDIDENDSSLPRDAPANAQGKHRLDRGRFFYEESLRIAGEMQAPIAFQKAEVVDGTHSSLRMVYGGVVSNAADITKLGPNAAFNLLFN